MELGDSKKAPNREYLTVQCNFDIFLGLHVFGAITIMASQNPKSPARQVSRVMRMYTNVYIMVTPYTMNTVKYSHALMMK